MEPVSSVGMGREPADAFAAMSRADVDRAYRLAWAILGNDEEAADATQDALTTAWQQRDSLRDPDALEAWLSRILVNKCRDRLRSPDTGTFGGGQLYATQDAGKTWKPLLGAAAWPASPEPGATPALAGETP